MKRALPLIVLVLVGCAERKPAKTHLVVPRQCLISVELTTESRCEAVAPDKKLVCHNLKLNKIPGCEKIEVIK